MSPGRTAKKLARPGGLELPTFWFVARRSIQLSYGRAVDKYYHRLARRIQPPQEFTFCTRKASEPLSCIREASKAGSPGGFARRRWCAAHKTSAMRFGAAPEQGRQRQYRHHFEAGNGALIAEMNVKRVLNGICRRGQQNPQLIGEAGH